MPLLARLNHVVLDEDIDTGSIAVTDDNPVSREFTDNIVLDHHALRASCRSREIDVNSVAAGPIAFEPEDLTVLNMQHLPGGEPDTAKPGRAPWIERLRRVAIAVLGVAPALSLTVKPLVNDARVDPQPDPVPPSIVMLFGWSECRTRPDQVR